MYLMCGHFHNTLMAGGGFECGWQTEKRQEMDSLYRLNYVQTLIGNSDTHGARHFGAEFSEKLHNICMGATRYSQRLWCWAFLEHRTAWRSLRFCHRLKHTEVLLFVSFIDTVPESAHYMLVFGCQHQVVGVWHMETTRDATTYDERCATRTRARCRCRRRRLYSI